MIEIISVGLELIKAPFFLLLLAEGEAVAEVEVGVGVACED